MYKFVQKIWHGIVWIIKGFFHLLHINLNEKQMEGFLQFVKFGIIGVSNTIVSYVRSIVPAVYLPTDFRG